MLAFERVVWIATGVSAFFFVAWLRLCGRHASIIDGMKAVPAFVMT